MNSRPTNTPDQDADRPGPAGPSDAPPEVEYSRLAGDAPYVIVVHEGLRYQLRATKNGRLILNR